MSTVDAIYAGGVFRPLERVPLAENQRVQLTFEPASTASSADWLDEVNAFQEEVILRRGMLPDSTPLIAEDRRRHE